MIRALITRTVETVLGPYHADGAAPRINVCQRRRWLLRLPRWALLLHVALADLADLVAPALLQSLYVHLLHLSRSLEPAPLPFALQSMIVSPARIQQDADTVRTLVHASRWMEMVLLLEDRVALQDVLRAVFLHRVINARAPLLLSAQIVQAALDAGTVRARQLA
jgi:hypothetical protein